MPELSPGANVPMPTGVSQAGFFNDSYKLLGAQPTTVKTYKGTSNPIRSLNVIFYPACAFMNTNGGLAVGSTDQHISPYPGNFSTLECICLRTNIHSSNFSTYGNEIGTGGLDPGQDSMLNTSMLARIPVNVDAVTRMIYYTDNGNDMYSMFIQSRHLDRMQLAITDDSGRHIAEAASLRQWI